MTLSASGGGKLGTFGGVFTPSVLTILGPHPLPAPRLRGRPWRARAKPWRSSALATAISLLTSLSLAAIATNRRVRGGGDYYLISRSLGVAYGGALGLVLFAAQAISVALLLRRLRRGDDEHARHAVGVGPADRCRRRCRARSALAYLGVRSRDALPVRDHGGCSAPALASFFVGVLARSFDGAQLARNWQRRVGHSASGRSSRSSFPRSPASPRA